MYPSDYPCTIYIRSWLVNGIRLRIVFIIIVRGGATAEEHNNRNAQENSCSHPSSVDTCSKGPLGTLKIAIKIHLYTFSHFKVHMYGQERLTGILSR